MSTPLLPERHPDRDFFICDFGEVIPKSDIATMEHPLFTLSTKRDTAIRHYEHNGNTVTIAPSAYGLATIKDKDILIYAISQLMAGINQGDTPSRKIRFKAHDLLVTTNRGTGGTEYKLLKEALERLRGTSIQTNIKTGTQEITEGFGIIDSYKIVTEDAKTKRMIELELTLSEWLFNSVLGQEVLSINRDYFRLRKPIERRIYEIARKHCGSQKQWRISIKNLNKKIGTSRPANKLKSLVLNPIIEHNHLPDYHISLDGDNVVFKLKVGLYAPHNESDEGHPLLNPETMERAKAILGRNHDVYAIEAEWIEWWAESGKITLEKPDGAFIGFCKQKVKK